ncbi:MAG: hypothetical protein LBI27_05335 [Clostridiales bacterium]|jgi:hypothetical protein|nr:hypothetical protein [Clostridiales bacterium]
MQIKNLKLHDENENIRLTWNWPQDIEIVYVNEKLFTLQEYKKLGGCILPKKIGVSTYHITLHPHEETENKITFICEVKIYLKISEHTGKQFKNHKIIISSENDVPAGIIHYVKNDVVYEFGETLEANIPVTRIVRTGIDDSFRIFINEENAELYRLI